MVGGWTRTWKQRIKFSLPPTVFAIQALPELLIITTYKALSFLRGGDLKQQDLQKFIPKIGGFGKRLHQVIKKKRCKWVVVMGMWKDFTAELWRNRAYYLMGLPGMALIFVFERRRDRQGVSGIPKATGYLLGKQEIIIGLNRFKSPACSSGEPPSPVRCVVRLVKPMTPRKSMGGIWTSGIGKRICTLCCRESNVRHA